MIRLAIRRPVATAMVYLAISLLGIAAWRGIPLELLPDTQLPQLTVTATWPGASPESTEGFLTAPIEAAIQQVRGVERVRSTSTEGRASISVEFQREVDMDFARLELAERLRSVQRDLPLGAFPPSVSPYVPPEFEEQMRPFLEYTVTGPYTTEGLRAQVDAIIVEGLADVEGVAGVHVEGGRQRLLEIELDPARIDAFGIDVATIRARLGELEFIRDAGLVDVGGAFHTLAIRHRVGSVGGLLEQPVLSGVGRTVRLRDVAAVRDTHEEATAHYRIDGRPAISFRVMRQTGSNAIRVSDAAKERLAELVGALEPGVRLILDNDESEAIRAQLTEMWQRALISVVVIFGVLLLFLRSFASAGIVFATISFSVLITVNVVYWSGLSFNVLTLMGLAMGFGMVVDNAIVVLENVYRHMRGGRSGEESAERGAREVVLPVVAATVTTLIVVIPFVYLQGELRLFYLPLAAVIGVALTASVFVAFSFIPALAARMLGRREPAGAAGTNEDRRPLYARAYGAAVGLTLHFPWATVLLAALLFGGSWYLFDENVLRGVIWNPYRQEQTIIRVDIRPPRGEALARTDELARFLEERLGQMPSVDRFVTRVQPENARIEVSFTDSVAQTFAPHQVLDQLTGYAASLGGGRITVSGLGNAFSLGGAGEQAPNYRIRVFGYNYDAVREIAEDLARRLTAFSRIAEVDTNASARGFTSDRVTELVVEPDRERLALHGLAARDLVTQVSAAIAGSEGRGSVVRIGGEEVAYALKLAGHEGMDVLALQDVAMRGAAGEGVRLSEIATIREREVPGGILRENQQYERTIGYEFRGPVRLGDVVRDAVIETTQLPPGYRLEGRTEFRISSEDQQQIYAVLALALLLVFMLTAGLFESLRHPFVILLTVPLALIGVFLIFYQTEATFTREAYMGVIMMAGIVVNNAILLVAQINRLLREGGLELRSAIRQGTLDRTRPILMTSLTTIGGMLPLVLFAQAADARIWNSLAYVLIGGMTSSTLLVLTVTPALYLLVERSGNRATE